MSLTSVYPDTALTSSPRPNGVSQGQDRSPTIIPPRAAGGGGL